MSWIVLEPNVVRNSIANSLCSVHKSFHRIQILLKQGNLKRFIKNFGQVANI